MNLPRSVRVGPHDWTVELVPQDTLPDQVGRTRHHVLSIQIEDGQADAQAIDTLLHECLHALCGTYDAGLDHSSEERVVAILAPGLLSLLRDNPKLARLIVGD